MGIILSCRNLTKGFGSRPLFEGLSFGLNEKERAGLIGPNGAGKSTLLKILAGSEKSDDGELAVRRGLQVRYLAQTDSFENEHEEMTVREDLVASLRELDLEEWELEMRVENGLAETGCDPDQKVASLSGGWRKRLAILEEVIREPDLLFLDEPTNHLDLEGVLWLERFLVRIDFAIVVVTHDRRFLEAVCNRVIELNKRYAEGYFSSVGNYSQFVENRAALFEAQAAQEESARNVVRREIEWLRRGPKARTTKQKARIDRAGVLIDDLAELSYRNAQDRTARIDFSHSRRRSRKLVEFIQVEKTRGGRKLFGPTDLILGPGDKLGLLGGNGSGKSTLLKLMAGELEPDSGRIKRAENLKVVYFDQQREQLDLTLSLKRALCEKGEFVEYKGNPIHVVGWADRFLFSKSQLDTPLSRLSGGEQARVLIARLMLRPADLLLLDEPTNDLDINSLEVLETSMMEFSGALVLVTHDRYLLDRVSDQIVELDGRGTARFFADLAQWEDYEAKPPASSAPIVAKQEPVESESARALRKSRELSSLESRIASAEEECRRAKAALEDPAIASNAEELIARQINSDEAQARLDKLWDQAAAFQH